MILSQAEKAVELHADAEKEAERAITQLEDFITEQEELVGNHTNGRVLNQEHYVHRIRRYWEMFYMNTAV